MGLLLGGVLAGVGVGFVIDGVARTAPFGIIAGTLAGFVLSVFAAIRTARAMSEQALRDWGPPQDLPPEDDND